jgi:hypothetical protein
MKRSALILTALFAVGLLETASYAQEQAWLSDRRYREGIGIRVGDLELHPGLAGEFGYDSNYYHRSDSGAEGSVVGTLRLRITPSFSIATLSDQRRDVTPGSAPPDFEFRGDVSATYNEFFPVTGTEFERSNVHEQRNVGGNLGLSLGIMPRRTWSATLFGDLGRAINPTDQGLPASTFNRITTRTGGELVYTPGGGLLDWRLGYAFNGTFFEDFDNLTNVEHELMTRGRWRFLPRTAVLYDARFGFISYPSAGTTAQDKTSSHPVRTRLGLSGLITPSFALMMMAGYGASFYTGLQPQEQEDFDSIIGQAEVKWFLTPNPKAEPGAATLALSSVALGFDRDFQDSFLGTYFARNRGYLDFSYFFGGAFLLTADGSVSANHYPTLTAFNYSDFTDVRLDGTLFGEYRIKDSIGINGTLHYGQNISGVRIETTDPPNPPAIEELKWKQLEAYIGVRWFM